jgi:Na+-transporting NADH:ubiquinone oxidoreductase subunit NqrE
MSANRQTRSAVIARLDRAIQYAAAIVFLTTAGVYWMPAFAGMTGARENQ